MRCFLTAVALATCLAPGSVNAARPNLVIVLADDLGYSDLGCYGGEIKTPNIDRLADGGVKLTQMYNSARCCPSRASLMTGLYPAQAGIGDFTTNRPNRERGPGYLGRLNDRCVTLAEALKPAGYGCYYVGKWHMHTETGPIKRGFDEFYGYTRGHSHDQYDADYYIRLPEGRAKEIAPPSGEFYATDVFNQYALEFLDQAQKRGGPWLLFVGHSSPHFPVQAPADRADKYYQLYQRGWDELRSERFARMRELGLVDGKRWELTPRSLVPVDRREVANGFPGDTNPAWKDVDAERQADLARRMAVFAAMVEGVDQGVGQIVDRLAETDQLDNTLILFLSDNGACYEWGPFGFDGVSRRGTTTLHSGASLREIGGPGTHHSYGSGWANLGNTPFRLYKHFTHEGGISTPMIAHWPAGFGARKEWARDPAHVMDIMPTLLDAAGVKYPATSRDGAPSPNLEGLSLLPVMRGEQLDERVIGFDHQHAHALRQGDWKLVRGKRFPSQPKWELYNLAEDRCETRDLASTHPERTRGMVAAWTRWAKRVGVIWEGDESTVAADRDQSPCVANRGLVIEAEVEANRPRGVVLAHGGNRFGYALHFVEGRLAFDVRVSGEVTRVMTKEALRGRIAVRATLSADVMTVSVNGGQPIRRQSPGLITAEPLDGLCIGLDDQTSAGDYEAPNRLRGKVLSHKVSTVPTALTARRTSR
ncbi:MAG: arylsulfatase [Planctomycetota bacterium]